MLMPKNVKYKKVQKGRIFGFSSSLLKPCFGSFGLKAIESLRLNSAQIEACRKVITKHIKKRGKLWVNIFPDIPVTVKPQEVRMGKGKGNVAFWVTRVRAGKILFELSGVSIDLAKEAFSLAAYKLPVKTVFIVKKFC
jgi:large subunit ribosomal protein L16